MNLRPSQVLDLLARVPRGKVTVAKEIIRLAGDLRTDDAFAFLARIEGDGKLHPDVAIALMRAYWNFLEHPEVWQRLHAAAREQPALARATIRIPPTGLSPDGQRALSRHLALLLGHADAQVRKETLERLIAMPPGEGEPSLQRWPRSSMTSMSRELNSRPARCWASMQETSRVNWPAVSRPRRGHSHWPPS